MCFTNERIDKMKTYKVKKLNGTIKIDADWSKKQWQGIESQKLTNFMGQKPEHFPNTEFKMLYDDANIYVIFKVDDNYIKAVAKAHQASVCCDSCVEFFFTTGQDISQGYFNLETNCGGTMLLHHQIACRQHCRPFIATELDKVEISHSLPNLIEKEITVPMTWTVEYRLPLNILESYAKVQKPASGIKWRANFYKCADLTSYPHWLTWEVVDRPLPDFHRPEFFGQIVFE